MALRCNFQRRHFGSLFVPQTYVVIHASGCATVTRERKQPRTNDRGAVPCESANSQPEMAQIRVHERGVATARTACLVADGGAGKGAGRPAGQAVKLFEERLL